VSITAQLSREIPDYEKYDYSAVWKGRRIEDIVEKAIVSRWAVGETGIELGGGFGRITQVIEKRVRQTFMLDYSLNNLWRASSRLKKTTLVRSTLERLPFDDSVFDFIALIRVIHHVPDPDALLAEVVRVARNGATFVLGIANQFDIGRRKDAAPLRISPEGHRIYPTPLARYVHTGLERVEVLGVGVFDNRLGRKVERLSPLATLDLKTSRLWPAKSMLFVRYRVTKPEGKNEAHVKCGCGGPIIEGRCDSCGRAYGRIVDLVES